MVLRMATPTGLSRILGDPTGETRATLRCSGVMASAVLVAFVLLLSAPILAMLLLLLWLKANKEEKRFLVRSYQALLLQQPLLRCDSFNTAELVMIFLHLRRASKAPLSF